MNHFSNIWHSITRKRPISSNKTQYYVKHYSTCQIIYNNLQPTLPIVVCYLIANLLTEYDKKTILLSLFFAAFISILIDFCYADLTSSNRHCSRSSIRMAYELGGEILSCFIGFYQILSSILMSTLLIKSLSSTLQRIGHSHFESISLEIFGLVPWSNEPPDIFAIGISLAATILLSCGLQKSKTMKHIMNACVLVVCGMIGTLGVSDESRPLLQPPSIAKVLECTSTLMIIFQQANQSGRCLHGMKDQRQLKQSIFIGAMIISSVVLFLIAFLPPLPFRSSSPILEVFEAKSVLLIVGSLHIVMLGISISEFGEGSSDHIVKFAAEGFITMWISKESPNHFVHSLAHCFGGFFIVLISGLCTSTFILKSIVITQLNMNIIMVLILAHQPFRSASNQDACQKEANTSLWKAFQKLLLSTTQTFIRCVFHHRASSNRTLDMKNHGNFNPSDSHTDLSIPLLTDLQDSLEEYNDQTTAPLKDEIFPKVFISTFNSDMYTIESAYQMQNTEEPDFDNIVLEFQENSKISSHKVPIKLSSQEVLLNGVILISISIILSLAFSFSFLKMNGTYVIGGGIVFLILQIVILFLIQTLQIRRKCYNVCHLPVFPYIYVIVIIFLLFLWSAVVAISWRFHLFQTVGCIMIYFSYGYRNSQCAMSDKSKTKENSSQMILLPSLPPISTNMIEMTIFPQLSVSM